MKKTTYLRHPSIRIGLTIVSLVSILTGVILVGAVPQSTEASGQNVLHNGSFEKGFNSQGGCGMVGNGWHCFTNGGAANYGFYDDEWEPVVAEGEHSQLIEVNTKNVMVGDADRYAGIYQTVKLMPHAKYKLSLSGMIRTTNHEGDPWRYRVQVGMSAGKGGKWEHVKNWQDVGWDTYHDRLSPGTFNNYMTVLSAPAEYATLYIRVWKKWGVANEELDVNLDAISLTAMGVKRMKSEGGEAGSSWEGPMRPEGWGEPMMQGSMKPEPERVLVCGGENLVYNGDFEHGFNPASIGHVGRSWGSFTNGGAAQYGFYDEQWDEVVADGEHGQLIEINTKNIMEPDHDRYAGIYQRIKGLEVGKTYELRVQVVLRGVGNEDDAHRFVSEWGYNHGFDPNWEHVEKWQGMDVGAIQSRTSPSGPVEYKVQFEADAKAMVLFLRGWKKWGVPNVEMDLNYDGVRLVGCELEKVWPEMEGHERPMRSAKMMGGEPGHGMAGMMERPEPAEECEYVVKPGDTAGAIALQYGMTIATLAKANHLQNPDLIYVGQTLTIPACGDMSWMGGMAEEAEDADGEKPAEPAAEESEEEMEEEMEEEAKSEKPAEPTEKPTEKEVEKEAGKKEEQGPKHGSRPMDKPKDEGMMEHELYIVRPGDTLSQIAASHGVAVHAVAKINGIGNVNFIYVGQKLRLP